MANFFAKVGTLFLSRIMIRLCQLVSFFVLARILSLSEFGIYGIISSVIFFSGLVGNLGLRQSSTRLINSKNLHPGQLTSTLVSLWPILSLATSLCLVLLAPQQLTNLSSLDFLLVIFAVSAYLLLTILQGVLLGSGDAFGFALLDSGPRLVQAILVILLAVFELASLSGALFTFAIGFMVFVPVALIRCYKIEGFIRPSAAHIIDLISVGLVNTFSLIMVMLQDRVGIFMLGYLGMTAEAGNYFAAQRISEIFLDVATSLALVVFAEGARNKDPTQGLASAMRAAFAAGALFTILGLVIATIAPPIIVLVLGSGFEGARPALIVFCLGLGPLAAARVMSSAISGVGRPVLSGTVSAVGLIANGAVCALTLSHYGAVGAATSMLLGQLVCIAGYLTVCYMVFKIGLRQMFPVPQELKQICNKTISKLVRSSKSEN